MTLLNRLIAIEPTPERASLVGSAFKRQALVNGAAGRRAQVPRDLREMKAAYARALELAQKAGARDLYYPAANCLAADVALIAGNARPRPLDRDTVKIVRESLRARAASEPDFWSVVGEAELDGFEALAKGRLAAARRQLSRAYEDLHQRVTATRMWGSVYDTACLVLPNYAGRASAREKAAARELLVQLRSYAHPDVE